jgi:hypothetical protein
LGTKIFIYNFYKEKIFSSDNPTRSPILKVWANVKIVSTLSGVLNKKGAYVVVSQRPHLKFEDFISKAFPS